MCFKFKETSVIILFSLFLGISATHASSISGTVFHQDGVSPITGDGSVVVALYLHTFPHNYLTTVTVNTADGSYLIENVEAGQYDLRVLATNYVDEFWAIGGSVPYRHLADTITLADEQDLTGVDFQLDTGTTVSGTVYATDNVTPLNGLQYGLTVYAYANQSCGKMWDFPAKVSASGEYSMRVPAGIYYVNVSGNAHISEWWADPNSVRDCSRAQSLLVNSVDPVLDKDFQLEEGTRVSGHVYDNTGVSPITGDSSITIGFVTSDPCRPQGSVAGGPILGDGSYSYVVEQGTYYLIASDSKYVDEWWRNQNSVYQCNQAQPLTVGANDISNIDFQIASGNTISGTVYHGNTSYPYTHAQNLFVNIINSNPCTYDYSIVLSSAPVDTSLAKYSVQVPNGTYYLLLNTGNHTTNKWWANPISVTTDNCTNAQPLTVTGNNVYSGINFQLGPDIERIPFIPAIFTILGNAE